MSSGLTFKRGGALLLELLLQNDDGTSAPLTGMAFSAQLRDINNALVANLPIASTTTLGLARIEVLDTAAWPLGLLRCDVLVDQAGRRLISQTFSIRVEKQVTGSDATAPPPGSGGPASAGARSSITLAWNGGAVVAAGVFEFVYTAPFPFRVDSLDFTVGAAGGSFTANVQIVRGGAATSVTGLGAIAVNAAVKTNTAATAANTVMIGDSVQVTIGAVIGAPTDAVLCLNLTQT